MDPEGKVVMESILETKATTILEFLAGLRGTLSVTFEEGTWAAWLYDLLKPHVANLVVCNPRKNALLKHGNKSDKIDARKLADLVVSDTSKPSMRSSPWMRRRTPTWILCDHLEDQVTNLFGDSTATADSFSKSAEHGPIQFEPSPVPPNNSFWLDE